MTTQNYTVELDVVTIETISIAIDATSSSDATQQVLDRVEGQLEDNQEVSVGDVYLTNPSPQALTSGYTSLASLYGATPQVETPTPASQPEIPGYTRLIN